MLINKIKIKDRARTDLGDISQLADDIKRNGLIHPIVLDNDNNVLVGCRRFTALITLGLESLIENVHFRYIKDLTNLQKREIELSENIKRKDFSWQEEVNLKNMIHELRCEIANESGTTHRIEDTAKELNMSVRQLNDELTLAKELKNNSKLENVKDKTTANTLLRRDIDAKRRAILTSEEPIDYQLLHGDSLELLKTIPDASADCALVDPPFGISLPNRDNWIKKYNNIYGNFNDNKDDALMLLQCVLLELKRILKTGAHCWVFFATQNYREVEDIIKSTLGAYQNAPAFWIKRINKNFKPYHRLTINYEPFFFCYNYTKQREFEMQTNAVFSYEVSKNKQHPAEKPIDLYKNLIKLSTKQGEVVIDPFAGSGKSMQAAVELSRIPIGIEIEKQHYDIMIENVKGANDV